MNVNKRFKRSFFLFALVLCVAIFTPGMVHADEAESEDPFELSFTLNSLSEDAELSTDNPSIEIGVSFSEEVYFTRLYICEESVDTCNQGSAVKHFSPNATTTSKVFEWGGGASGGGFAAAGSYRVVARFYRYAIQEEALEETAPWQIEVALEQGGEDETEGEESDPPPPPPFVGFSLNGGFIDVSLSSTSPVTIVATSSEEVYFTTLFICSAAATVCDSGTHTAAFEINATSTEISRTWDGTDSTAASSSPGVYAALIGFYAYADSSTQFTATASLTITIPDSAIDGDEEDDESPPAYTLITADSIQAGNATVWDKEGSPYVIEGNVYLRSGSLSIEPGVVVKFKPEATLTVHADAPLAIQGTKDNPVIFTSIADDLADGQDTNNDGDATAPAPGDWGYASFGGGSTNRSMSLAHLYVRYGGGVPITDIAGAFSPSLYILYPWFHGQFGTALTLETVAVSHSADVGLALSIGRNHSVSVSSSSFHSNARFGVYKVFSSMTFNGNDDTGGLDLSGSWWGSETGPYHAVRNPDGLGNALGIGAEGSGRTKYPTISDWLSSDPFAPPPPPPAPEPDFAACCSSVLFLPGIKGSRLYMTDADGEDRLWDPSNPLETPDDIAQLALDEEGQSINSIYVKLGDIVDMAAGTEYYAPIVTDLESLADDGTIGDFEAIAYDWRLSLDDIVNRGYEDDGKIYYSLATSTPYIEQTLRRLAQESQTGKVTILAHSNGGLVAKELIQKLGEVEAQSLIDQLIFVGVPQSGAPQAIGALLYGYREDIAFANLSKASARTLAENSPGAYHLLPSRTYFDAVHDIDHSVASFDGASYATERDAYGFQVNTWDELSAFLLAEEGGRVKPSPTDTKSANVLNSALVAYAKETHDTLDVWVPPADITLHQIAGWGVDTVAGIEFFDNWNAQLATGPQQPRRAYKPIIIEDGDGVVPVPSALLVSTSTENVKRWWVNMWTYNNRPGAHVRKHGDMFLIPELRNFIELIIEHEQITDDLIHETQPPINDLSKKLRFFLYSPLTLTVLNADGNIVGEYDEFGDVKYVTLPAGPTYTIQLNGYDSGTFALQIEEVQGGTVVASSTVANVPSTDKTTATLTIGDGIATASALSVDIDGDGEEDAAITLQENSTVLYEPPVEEPPPEAPATTSPAGGGPLWSASSPAPKVLGVATTSITEITKPSDITQSTTSISTNSQVSEPHSERTLVPIQQLEQNDTPRDSQPPPPDVPTQVAAVAQGDTMNLLETIGAMISNFFRNLLRFFVK